MTNPDFPYSQPAPGLILNMPASFPGAAEHLAWRLGQLAEKCRPGYCVSKTVLSHIEECHAVATAAVFAIKNQPAAAVQAPEGADNTVVMRQALEALELSSPHKCGQSDDLWLTERRAHADAIAALRAALAAQPQATREYRQANPLGGPAKVFRAMADAIEAGDSYEDTLRRFEYAEVRPATAEGDAVALADGFDGWWAAHSIHRVLSPGGFARMVWEASARHNRKTVLGATDSTSGFYPEDDGSTPSGQATEVDRQLGSDHEIALMEGHRIPAMDAYFKARPSLDGPDERKAFEAGYQRGWRDSNSAHPIHPQPKGTEPGTVPVSVLEDIFTTLKRANTDGSICDTIWHGTAETLFDFIEVAIEQAALPPVTPSIHATIGKLLAEAMDTAVANGANSVSMPDEFVELALWLSGATAQASAPGADTVPYAKFAELLRQEHALSDAYVRLREIIGAMDPPTVSDSAQLWAYVESVARSKLAAAQASAVAPERPDWAEDCARLLLDLKDALAVRCTRPDGSNGLLWDRAFAMYERMLLWANPISKPPVQSKEQP